MAGRIIDMLRVLEMSKGYDIALLSTFNFEIDFFEKAILSRLIKNSIRKVSVFVDAEELNKSLRGVSSMMLGQRYVVNPVSIHGAYHPKVILLLGEKCARLLIGSGNIKTSGYCINNEIFDCVDYDSAHQETRKLIVDAINFFLNSNRLTPGLDMDLLESITRKAYYREAPDNPEIQFLENTAKPIFEQIVPRIEGVVTEIRIAVPYYDNELKCVDELSKAFPKAILELWLQRGKNTFSGGVEDERMRLHVFEEVSTSEHKNRHFYHGKVFLFRAEQYDYMLYGSANCTLSAMIKTFKEQGNVECCLFSRGNVGEYDDFYDSFVETEGMNPDGYFLTHETIQAGNVFFKYGVTREEVALHFGYSVKPDSRLRVMYDGQELTWQVIDKEIIVNVKREQIKTLPFEVELVDHESCEKVLCWFIDKTSVELYRMTIAQNAELVDSPSFGEGEKYREDMLQVLQKYASCAEDYQQQEQSLRRYQSSLQTSDLDVEADESGEFVINIELTDEDYRTFRQFHVIERIRDRLTSRYFYGIPWFFSSERTMGIGKRRTTDELTEVRHVATSEEKSFARFVKSKVRTALDKSFVEIVSEKHFIGLIAIILDIFDKYKNTDDMFSREYLVSARSQLIIYAIQKSANSADYGQMILPRAIGIILDDYLLTASVDNESLDEVVSKWNRAVLKCIEDHYQVRNTYPDFFVFDDIDPEKKEKEIVEATEYIESLYGYHDIEQIKVELRKQYGESAEVQIRGNAAEVIIYSMTPADHLKPDVEIIRELLRYSANVQKLETIRITICNLQDMVRENTITQIQYLIQLTYMKCRRTITRANGMRQEGAPSFLAI